MLNRFNTLSPKSWTTRNRFLEDFMTWKSAMSVSFTSRAQTAITRAAGSACNLFSRASPSPNWYVDDSDDLGQNQNSPKLIPTHLLAAPQMSVSAAPQTPSTHHPFTAQMSVSAAPQTPPHPPPINYSSDVGISCSCSTR